MQSGRHRGHENRVRAEAPLMLTASRYKDKCQPLHQYLLPGPAPGAVTHRGPDRSADK